MTSRAAALQHEVQEALNGFVQDNNGRAPWFVEMKPDDWTFLRDHIKTVREAEGFDINTIDPAKVGGRENFRLFGLAVCPGAEDLPATRPVAVTPTVSS